MDEKHERNSNFELLRIILMLMIIVLHYCNSSMGGALANVPKGTINYYLVHFIESACIIAVNVFILITGYFMNNKTEIKVSKILKLFYLTIIYAVMIFLGCIITNKFELNLSSIKLGILTITDRWFVDIYCVLYLLIPYINRIIQSIDNKQYITLLVILIMFFYIWPTLWTNVTILDSGYGIINFITLYLIGAYIKLYCNEFKSFSKSAVVYVGFTIITAMISLVSNKAFQYNFIFNLVSSIALFEMFKAMNVKSNKIINKLATFTFSTYIIHENRFIVRELYREVFSTEKYYESNYLIVNLVVTAIGIYVLCVIIEWIRRIIMERYIDSNIEKIDYQIKV